jgi:hypothetical protein
VDLAASGIQLLTETPTHYLFARDNLIALVERTAEGYGSIGSTGIMTERGLAYLIRREQQIVFAGKGFEQPASPEEAAAVRAFSADLKAALEGSPA